MYVNCIMQATLLVSKKTYELYSEDSYIVSCNTTCDAGRFEPQL